MALKTATATTRNTSQTIPSSTPSIQPSPTVTPTITRVTMSATTQKTSQTIPSSTSSIQPSPVVTISQVHLPGRYHQPSCPATVITIAIVRNGTSAVVPAGGLTDAMIRAGGVVVGISLSPPLTNLSVEFASPSVFSFGVESLGVSDPRSYPSVVNLADIRCAFHVDTRRSVLCELPASPNYVIRDAENLRITAPAASMLNVGSCGSAVSVVVGTVAVSPATADKLTASLQAAFAVVTAVSTVVISLLGDGSPIETQVLVMILDSPCAANYDRKSVAWVRYIVMPGAALGPGWTMGVNVLITVGVFALHCITVLVMFRRRRDTATLQQVRTSLMFPGISIAVAQIMYVGVMYGTMTILRVESGAAGAAAVVGLVYMVLVPGVVLYLLAFEADVLYYPYDWKVEGVSKGRQWLYPHGFWSPKAQMLRLFSVVGPYRIGMHYAALSPFLLGLTVAILMAALPAAVLCDYLYVSVGVAGIVVGLATLVGNPMRSRLQSHITALCLALLGLLAILQIVAIRSNSESIVIAKGACNYLLIGLLALRAFHSLFIFVFEFRSKDELIANMRERGDSIITEEEPEIKSKPSAFDDEDLTTGGTTPHNMSPTTRSRHANTDGGKLYIMGSGMNSEKSCSSSVANSPASEDLIFSAPLETDLLITSWNVGVDAGSNSKNTTNSPQLRSGGQRGMDRSAMSGSSSVPISGPNYLLPRRGSAVSSSSLSTSFNIRTTAFNSSIIRNDITSPVVSGLVPLDRSTALGSEFYTPKNSDMRTNAGAGHDWVGGNNSGIGGIQSPLRLIVNQPFVSPTGSFNDNLAVSHSSSSGNRSPQLRPRMGSTPLRGGESLAASPPTQGIMMRQVFGGSSYSESAATSPVEENLYTSPVQLAFNFN